MSEQERERRYKSERRIITCVLDESETTIDDLLLVETLLNAITWNKETDMFARAKIEEIAKMMAERYG